jgi:hypothetical protein
VGIVALEFLMKRAGLGQIDGRSQVARELAREVQELVDALGGGGALSPQKLALVRMIASKRVRRRLAEQWALEHRDQLFDRRKRRLHPLILQLEQLEESEVRLLEKLGLERVAKRVGLVELLGRPSAEKLQPEREQPAGPEQSDHIPLREAERRDTRGAPA